MYVLKTNIAWWNCKNVTKLEILQISGYECDSLYQLPFGYDSAPWCRENDSEMDIWLIWLNKTSWTLERAVNFGWFGCWPSSDWNGQEFHKSTQTTNSYDFFMFWGFSLSHQDIPSIIQVFTSFYSHNYYGSLVASSKILQSRPDFPLLFFSVKRWWNVIGQRFLQP